MSDLFNYFVKAASAYKPDAAMRRGSYAQASDRGQYRSSTIGHQGLSRRTAAQLRQTHNLPAPGQQPTGPDAPMRGGNITQRGPRRPDVPSSPSPAPRPAAQPTQPPTVVGAPSTNPTAQPATASANQSSATVPGAPPARPGRLAALFSPHIPGVANLSDKAIRSRYVRGAHWNSLIGLDPELDKIIKEHPDQQVYNQMSQLGLNMYGDNSSQATAANTALQELDALRYRDDVARYNPLGDVLAATQGVGANATPEELALRQRPYSYAAARRQARPVMPRA